MFCRNCDKELIGSPEICPGCGARPIRGNSFCSNCGAATTELTEMCVKCGARLVGRVEAGLPKKNWFERHLNWTVVIASFIPVLIGNITILTVAYFPNLFSDVAIFILVTVGFIAYPIIILVVGIWALRQKGRSLWWLFLVVPFGWLPYACLKNKKC